MPSTGKTPRQRWPSCENSTRWMGEWSSLTSKAMMVRPRSTRTLPTTDRRRRVVHLERDAVQLAGQRGRRRIRRRVGRDDLHEIGPVRHGRGVPDENRFRHRLAQRLPRGLAFAAVEHVVHQVVVVLVVGLPDQRLQPFLVGAPAERRGRPGLAALPPRRRACGPASSDPRSRRAPDRRVENGF